MELPRRDSYALLYIDQQEEFPPVKQFVKSIESALVDYEKARGDSLKSQRSSTLSKIRSIIQQDPPIDPYERANIVVRLLRMRMAIKSILDEEVPQSHWFIRLFHWHVNLHQHVKPLLFHPIFSPSACLQSYEDIIKELNQSYQQRGLTPASPALLAQQLDQAKQQLGLVQQLLSEQKQENQKLVTENQRLLTENKSLSQQIDALKQRFTTMEQSNQQLLAEVKNHQKTISNTLAQQTQRFIQVVKTIAEKSGYDDVNTLLEPLTKKPPHQGLFNAG